MNINNKEHTMDASVTYYGGNDFKLNIATNKSVGYDLISMENKEKVERFVPTKIEVGIENLVPPPGYFGFIANRSSMGSKGFIILSGIIDPDYKGKIYVSLMSLNEHNSISVGDKIAQLIFMKYTIPKINGLDPTNHEKIRDRNGGFGSTGK